MPDLGLSATPRHEMLHYPFQTEHGLAWIILPREGITAADAERMAEMVAAVVVEEPRGSA